MEYRLFAACPVYLEDLLEQEVLGLGGKSIKEPGEDWLFLVLWKRSMSSL